MSQPRIVFLISIFSSLALSHNATLSLADENCPSVLLDQTDPDVAALPITDQEFNGNCYFHGSSFLAQIWMRKKWGDSRNEIQDPNSLDEEFQLGPEEEVNRTLDAENGRTCSTLTWNLKRQKELHPDLFGRKKIPKCNMFGLVRNEKGQLLRQPAEFQEKMKSLLLKKHPMPFAIEFCAGVYKSPEKQMIHNRQFRDRLTYLNEADQSENFTRYCGFHVAVVVGQKLQNGKCQFRVRNSWGTGADGSDQGYYWVDQDILSQSTLRVVTLSRH